MKRLIAVVLLVAFSGSVFAEGVIDVVPVERFFMSFNQYGGYGAAYTDWTAYCDGRRISEADFYDLTGDWYSEESARSRDAWGWSLFLGGAAVTTGGLVMAGFGESEVDHPTLFWSGVAVSWTGIASMCCSLFFTGKIRNYEYAARLAEEYNATYGGTK